MKSLDTVVRLNFGLLKNSQLGQIFGANTHGAPAVLSSFYDLTDFILDHHLLSLLVHESARTDKGRGLQSFQSLISGLKLDLGD